MPRGTPVFMPPPAGGMLYSLPYEIYQKGQFVRWLKNLYIDRSDFSIKVRNGFYTKKTFSNENVLNGFYYYDNAHITVINTDKNLYASVTTTSQDNWQTITPSGITSFGEMKFETFFQTYLYVVMCDGVNNLMMWKQGDTTATVVTASPKFVDFTVQVGRIIGIDETKVRLRWSKIYDATQYPALAYIAIPEAKEMIAIVPLRNDISVLYCVDKVYFVKSVVGGDSNCFAIEKLADFVGPVNKWAVVSYNNLHYIVGKDKRVYVFNGNSFQDIGGPVQSILNSLGSDRTVRTFLDKGNGYLYVYWQDARGFANVLLYDLMAQIWVGYFEIPLVISRFFNGMPVVTTWNNLQLQWNSLQLTWQDLNKVLGTYAVGGNNYYGVFGYTDNGIPIQAEIIFAPIMASHDEYVLVEAVEPYITARKDATTINVQIGRAPNGYQNFYWEDFGYLTSIDTDRPTPLLLNNRIIDRFIAIRLVMPQVSAFTLYGMVAYIYKQKQFAKEMIL